MSKRTRQKAKRMRGRIAMILGLVLTVSLVLAILSSVRSGQAEELFRELTGERGKGLKAGASPKVGELTRYEKAKIAAAARAAEEEKALEEASMEVDPALRLENTVDFAALKKQNKDVYAWITIPATKVDYPVLQHPTKDEYYLNRTIDHVSGLPGSIYSEHIHPRDFSAPQTILYGHNMKNGTMFGSLHRYDKAAFFEEQPYVYIHLPDRTLLYEIFAAVRFSDDYLPAIYDFEEQESFEAFIEDVQNSPGHVREGMEAPFGRPILTLSTCIGGAPHNRFLVVCVLVGEYEKEEFLFFS